QPMRPAVEERLNVGGTERIAGGLERGGVGAGEEAVVETFKANAIAAQALLHPLMTVQTQLHRIRQIRTDFEKRRPPVSILHVEVIVVDGHRLAPRVEPGRSAVALPFMGLEGPHLFLSHADDDDAFAGGESGAVFRYKGILTRSVFKRDDRNAMTRGERLDGGDEA